MTIFTYTLFLAALLPSVSSAASLRALQEISSEIPQINDADWSITNQAAVEEGNVCDNGCEGDYAIFKDTLQNSPVEIEVFFTVKGRYAVAAGTIGDNFPTRLEELKTNHPEVDILILVECPGSANNTASIIGSRFVHANGYQTCVPSDIDSSHGHVASGGTDFFASGVKRYATPGARVGIHSWAGENNGVPIVGSDLPSDDPEHLPFLQFYTDTCIPEDFYWETLSHGVEPMYYLTEEDFVNTFPYFRNCRAEVGNCNIDSSEPSQQPSPAPSDKPSTGMPSSAPTTPTTHIPSNSPSKTPSNPVPSDSPSAPPSKAPTNANNNPSNSPSTSPSQAPSQPDSTRDVPTSSISSSPSDIPTISTSEIPTKSPSKNESTSPSDMPSIAPTESSSKPSSAPSKIKSLYPSQAPTLVASNQPTTTIIPSNHPSGSPNSNLDKEDTTSSNSPTVTQIPSPKERVSGYCDQTYTMTDGSTTYSGLYCSNDGSLNGATDGTKTNAIISQHGTNRDGDNYLSRVQVAGELTDGVVYGNSIIVAPQFLIADDLAALGTSEQSSYLYWSSPGWKIGDLSQDGTYPRSFRVSSFDCMTRIIELMLIKYPNLEKITVIGHSAGGQFVHRYSAGGTAENLEVASGKTFQYVVMNPSSWLYYSNKRAEEDPDNFFAMTSKDFTAPETDCVGYNNYKYGLQNMNNYMSSVGGATLRSNYISRRVMIFLGDQDTVADSNLDRTCMADLQGANRYERGLIFYNYALLEFGAQIADSGRHNLRIAPGVGHSSSGMYASQCGQIILFGYNGAGTYKCNDVVFSTATSPMPTRRPTPAPSAGPSMQPSVIPSAIPSASPSVSKAPSAVPSQQPSQSPTTSKAPSQQPSQQPSESPSVSQMPSHVPSQQPSQSPSVSQSPSNVPSQQPSDIPSNLPSALPSMQPSVSMMPSLSSNPSAVPSNFPSSFPSQAPSQMPSMKPSVSMKPSLSSNPSAVPSSRPSGIPSAMPSMTQTNNPTAEAEFHRIIQAEMLNQKVLGAAYAYRGPGMTVPALGVYGKLSASADTLVDLDTTFQLASLTKPFTAAVVGVLVDKGVIKLDDSICDALGLPLTSTACHNPSYPNTNVTWRMLATHRSSIARGVPDYEDDANDRFVQANYGPAGLPNYGPVLDGNTNCPIDDIEEFYLDLFTKRTPQLTTVGQDNNLKVQWYDSVQRQYGMNGMWNATYGPGTTHSYSNVGMAYVAALVRKAVLKTPFQTASFEAFFQEHVAKKVGMERTSYFRDTSNTNVAVPHDPQVNGVWREIGHYCWAEYADGSLYASIKDMAKWGEAMITKGVNILWSQTTADNHVFGCQERDVAVGAWPGTAPKDCNNSLGWFKGEIDESDWSDLNWTNAITHSGSEGGIATSMLVLPESNSYVIVMSNTEGFDDGYFSEGIVNVGRKQFDNTGSGTFPPARRNGATRSETRTSKGGPKLTKGAQEQHHKKKDQSNFALPVVESEFGIDESWNSNAASEGNKASPAISLFAIAGVSLLLCHLLD